LRNMAGLQELSLYRTKVTNAGLAKLRELHQLREMDLRYSRATASGVHDFLAAIPNCDVKFQASSGEEAKRTTSADAVETQGEIAIAGWLRSIGGTVQMQNGHVTAVSMKSTSITDREVRVLSKLPQITELNLRNTEVSEVGLAHLASLLTLR